MRGKEFWDTNFEKRYLKRRAKWKKLPLKVFLMPHSHNDPGWLKTYEEYYFHQTSKILQNMIEKLRVHTNMTFIWSEISFLSLWYERAHPSLRQQMKELVHSGRLEVATGGWVMTDEANVHLYAMLDQLIEGQQWLWNVLGVQPVSGWSVDPFGHGAAVPYLLKESGVKATVVQRIHYAWKQWLAEQQLGDFQWRQVWDVSGEADILCHNRPYDIYSIKHSCGPHPQICLGYDFRKVPGEYTEYTIKSVPIDDHNVKQKAELLLEQYGRTGSLYPHNVVLVPIGDDFRYDHASEWDQQYSSYQRLLTFINNDPKYHANIQFGTLRDYFNEVQNRMRDYPSLQGDFFVYSDIFSEGRPAYWSGYYTTRPYWKVLDRQLEAALRSAEILYTWAYAWAVQEGQNRVVQLLEKDYEKLVRARRNLALFQHHDAITGTSKAYVMHDYAIKLHEGLHDTIALAGEAAEVLLLTPAAMASLDSRAVPLHHLQPDFERLTYERLPRKLPRSVPRNQPRLIVLFNSLAQRRFEVVKVLVTSLDVRVTDEHGHEVPVQLNPVWNDTGSGMAILSTQFELLFVADLAPLSVITYCIHRTERASLDARAAVYSNNYAPAPDQNYSPPFESHDVLPGDIQLESDHLKLLFDGTTGMLRSITNKASGRVTQTAIRYAAYPSAQFKSGAYLFKPDPNAREPEEDVLAGAKPRLFIHSGPVASELSVMFGSVLMHTTRILHVAQQPLASAVHMENTFNLGGRYNSTETPGFPPHFRETELFMRVMTDIDNGAEPTFYTDQSGLHMQRRARVQRIGIQGNYFPITSAAMIEDNAPGRRLTLLTNHAAGAAAWQQGWLEVMVERRTFYDDARGMGEGVTDQKRTVGRYWLLVEDTRGPEPVARLSLAAHHLANDLNYPTSLLVLEGLNVDQLRASAHLLNQPLPCPLHLVTLRTLPDPQYPSLLPSKNALMVLQNQAPSCAASSSVSSCNGLGDTPFPGTELSLQVSGIQRTSLTGTKVHGTVKSLPDVTVPHHRLRALTLTFPSPPPHPPPAE
nr:alpha-mannosidase 2x-like [Penaeus vannamei]